MGKVYSSFFKRPARNWNVINRADRVLSREKPLPAPRHPSTQKQLADFERENPELLEAQKIKNHDLLENLQGLVVEPEKFAEIVREPRPLPQNRHKVFDPEFGYLEPKVVPNGKCTIRQVFDFMCSHQQDPQEFTAAKIAKDYKLDRAVVADVLHHFEMLNLHMPEKAESKAKKPSNEQKVLKSPGMLRKMVEAAKERTNPIGNKPDPDSETKDNPPSDRVPPR